MAKRKQEEEPAKATKKPTKEHTGPRISICIPLTIISGKNAYNLSQKTTILNQVARAATAYNVGEIIILDIPEVQETVTVGKKTFDEVEDESKAAEASENSLLAASLLQYFVTPPYLVKTVFANNDLDKMLVKFKHAAKLPKLSTLPFMANNNVHKHFREGIAIAKETPSVVKKGKKEKAKRKLTVTKWVNIGELEPLELNSREVPVHSRVTVDIRNKTIVSPELAYGILGNKLSFGYYTRVCKCLSQVFTELSVPEGYLGSVFVNCDDFFQKNELDDDLAKVPQFKLTEGNVLLLLGDYRDYAHALKVDLANLAGIDNVAQMFDSKLTIPLGVRIEDASWAALAKMNWWLNEYW